MSNNATEWLCESIKKHYPNQGSGFGKEFVREARKLGKFNPRDKHGRPNVGADGLHLKSAAVACFGPAWESRLREMAAKEAWVGEAGVEAVDLSTFRDLATGVAVEETELGYEQAASVGNQLMGVYPKDDIANDITIPEKAVTPDSSMDVPPAGNYPMAGFSPVWVKAPKPDKFGLISALTLEMVKANEAAEWLDDLMEVGRAVGQDELERKLRVIIGAVNNYNRLGVSTNTYLTAGAYINSITDFDITNGPKEFDRFLKLAALMRHPITGKSIQFKPTAVLTVPGNMFATREVSRAVETRVTTITNTLETTTVSTGNPLGENFPTFADPEVERIAAEAAADGGLGLTATQAATLTILADFQRAFKWRQVEPFATYETDSNDESWPPHFFQDVVHAVKARSWGKAFVREPRLAYRGYKT